MFRGSAVTTIAVGTIALAGCADGPTSPESAVKLAFTAQPSNATAGATISPAVAVAIKDASDRLVTSATNVVTVTIATGTSDGILTGSSSVAAVNGIATFSNLRIGRARTGYTLTAAAAGLTEATSAAFDILEGPATPEGPATSITPLIAFASRNGIEEIHSDGSGRRVLIADRFSSEPAWSPDGAKLAFSRRSADFQTCDIYIAGADGSGAQKITTPIPSFPCAGSPSWSPDGTKIAFAADAGTNVWEARPPGARIYQMNADGSGAQPIYADSSDAFFFQLTWSPDGKKLAFAVWVMADEGYSSIVVMNVDGSNARAFTSGGCEFSPAWSPDGSQIAYAGSCENGGPYAAQGPFGIFVRNVDGSGTRNLLDVFPCLCDATPAWSPDGGQLVFSHSESGKPEHLYIINRDGTGLRQLTGGSDITEMEPAWRPSPRAASAVRSALR